MRDMLSGFIFFTLLFALFGPQTTGDSMGMRAGQFAKAFQAAYAKEIASND